MSRNGNSLDNITVVIPLIIILITLIYEYFN